MSVRLKPLVRCFALVAAAACSAGGLPPNMHTAGQTLHGLPSAQRPDLSRTFTTVHMFQGPPTDGWVPLSGLVADSSGTLYGTTAYGGSAHSPTCPSGCGTAFAVTASGDNILYSFSGPPHGTLPQGALTAYKGGFSGVTQLGGAHNQGSVFELKPSPRDPQRWTVKIIYSFKGAPDDGADASGNLTTDATGALYGTTFMGGNETSCLFGAGGCGSAFKLTPPAPGKTGWHETVIHSFSGVPDGAAPVGDLVWAAGGGAFYGVTEYGGSSTQCPYLDGCGTLYRLSPKQGKSGWSSTIVHSFNVAGQSKADGSLPSGMLTSDKNGVLYGTTAYGGGQGNCNVQVGLTSCGTVFSFAPASQGKKRLVESILYAFKGAPSDGAQPDQMVANGKHEFFGATAAGGDGPC